jgi:hypothetical protein
MVHPNDTLEELLCDDIPFTPEQRYAHFDFLSWKYKVDRMQKYPSFAEQFDTLYHGGYDAWKATIDAVKTEFPKP